MMGGSLPVSRQFTILSSVDKNDVIDLRVRKEEEVSNSALLAELGQQYEILSFSEELPSMNDIFINTVSGTNTTNA